MSDTEQYPVEYRIMRRGNGWAAEKRFTSGDDVLRAAWILPGWHTFKRSVSIEKVEDAIALDKSNRASGL